jgi:hypothetical protein
MKSKRLLSVIMTGTLALVAAVFLLNARTSRTQAIMTNAPLLTRDDAVARVMDGLFDETDNPRVVDVRLLSHKDAHEAMDITINYEQSDYPYEAASPVWVVAIAAENVNDIPLFQDGPVHYAGTIEIVNATDGQFGAIATFSDAATDPILQRLRTIPDLANQIEIKPLELDLEIQELAPPTATPATSR